MAPFFSHRSRHNRASTLHWLDQTYGSQSGFHNNHRSAGPPQVVNPKTDIHAFEDNDNGHTYDSTASSTEERLNDIRIDCAHEGLPMNVTLLNDERTENSPELATGMTSSRRMRNLATFALASTIVLTILLSLDYILNTILILLLFAPYPPPLRLLRFGLLIPLLAHESVQIKAKAELVLIFSTLSASSLLDWHYVGGGLSDRKTITADMKAQR